MRKILLIFYFLVMVCGLGRAQIVIPEFSHENVSKYYSLNALRDQYELIISYTTYGQGGGKYGGRDVLVLTYNGQWNGFLLQRNYEKEEIIRQVRIEQHKINEFWAKVIELDILKIRGEKELHDDPCFDSYTIGGGSEDGSWFEFEFMTSTDYKVLSYYMPKQNNDFCPMPDREKNAKPLPVIGPVYRAISTY